MTHDKVKRYDLDPMPPIGTMEESSDGEWVKAEDYDRLAALMPRTWTAETIKDAVDGWYWWRKWKSGRWNCGYIGANDKHELDGYEFYGPIPHPSQAVSNMVTRNSRLLTGLNPTPTQE